MKGFDTYNLRHDETFETELSKDVFWVPVSSLGKSSITNKEMLEISKLTPEAKFSKINNLYEAIQLFQISEFIEEIDITLRHDDNSGLDWEYHKPGYFAVQSNKGCCASDSTWLTYMLKDKYEEVGLISASNINTNGHVFNYIKHKGMYYIIDMMCFNDVNIKYASIETGKLIDFRKGKYITGICVKTDSLDKYADFFCRYMVFKSKDFVLFKHEELECSPLAIDYENDLPVIVYPRGKKIKYIENARSSKKIKYRYIDYYESKIDWK